MSRGSNRISGPVQIGVDLIRLLQVFQLLEPGESPELIGFRLHADPLEELTQLTHAIARSLAALVPGQLPVDTIEADAVAAVVTGGCAYGNRASGELLADHPGELTNAIVLGIPSHVEDLAADGFLRSHETAIDRLTNVIDVHDRPPGAAVAGHGDAASGPGERAQVVDHDVEAHAR